MITVSHLSRRTEPSRFVISTASSKKIKSSLPFEAPSTIFTKSTSREECKRYIVKVVLDADLWSLNAGVPIMNRLFSFCNTCLVQKVDSTDSQITDLIKKEAPSRASISAVLDSEMREFSFLPSVVRS